MSEMHFMGLSPDELLECAVPDTSVIVVGSAPCAGDDYERALEMEPCALTMAVNNGCADIGVRPQLLGTLHAGMKDLIGPQYMPIDKMYDAFVVGEDKNNWNHERIDMPMHGYPTMGTSAMFTVLAAVYLGFERIVIVGCPLTRHLYGNGTTLNTWKLWSPMLCQRATSLSGNTKRILDAARNGEDIDLQYLLDNYATHR